MLALTDNMLSYNHAPFIIFVCFQISRLQNPTLYSQYVVRKKQMEQSLQGAGVQVERMLWHGTGADTLESISLHGFNRSYCGKNGAYFQRSHL